MKKLTCRLLAALAVMVITIPAFATEANQTKMNGICLGNSDVPGSKSCASVDPDDYYEQFPQTTEDFQRNERYQRNHQTYVCRSVSPSYADGASVREYVVTDPRDCR